ncbi:MAG: hotdog fold domain-containing protein [Gemmatimonadales bacterium]
MANPTERVTGLWRRLAPIPGGSWLFSRILGFMVPYTATIGAHVRELRPGYARVTLRDRRRVRNHLNSIHAVALVNLGEVTSGLAMIAALPPGTRSIVTNLSIEYLKKARGTLVAVGTTGIPAPSPEETEHLVQAEIRDAGDDVVARISVRWNLRSSAL